MDQIAGLAMNVVSLPSSLVRVTDILAPSRGQRPVRSVPAKTASFAEG